MDAEISDGIDPDTGMTEAEARGFVAECIVDLAEHIAFVADCITYAPELQDAVSRQAAVTFLVLDALCRRLAEAGQELAAFELAVKLCTFVPDLAVFHRPRLDTEATH